MQAYSVHLETNYHQDKNVKHRTPVHQSTSVCSSLLKYFTMCWFLKNINSIKSSFCVHILCLEDERALVTACCGSLLFTEACCSENKTKSNTSLQPDTVSTIASHAMLNAPMRLFMWVCDTVATTHSRCNNTWGSQQHHFEVNFNGKTSMSFFVVI